MREPPRELLRSIPGVELVEPAEWELCCGSAGIYNVMQPEAAEELGRRKARNLAATGRRRSIAAANPGCTMQIAAHHRTTPVPVVHPMRAARPLAARAPRSRALREGMSATVGGVEIAPAPDPSLSGILGDDAVGFVAELHRRFEPRRRELLRTRAERDAQLRNGGTLAFLPDTREIREDDSWRVPEPPPDLLDRRVEITGPTDRKLMINALNSGAKTFMADFEDAKTPTWTN